MARPRSPALDYAQLPTEATNPRSARLDTMAADAVVRLMLNEEAKSVRAAAARADVIGRAAALVAQKLAAGGRLIYVGAGTSGRLGTLDAVECVPTFGVPPSRVLGIIAGGPQALTRSVEGAEDNARDAEQRLRRAAAGPADVICCIAASGVTPFARAALEYGRFRRAGTIFVTCGRIDQLGTLADVVVELPTGPEVIAGSTRLKAGTATKIVLNAISTAAFVLLGKTYGGLMIDVRPTNAKLWARAVRIVTSLTGLTDDAALKLIQKAGGRAKVALVMHHAGVSATRARDLLVEHKGSLRSIVGDLDEGGRRASPPRGGRGKEEDDEDADPDDDDDNSDDGAPSATAKGA
ncbi:MAG TPA: N-acetylmuramic acid 6-phosphate etherase [Polyangia bacterium]|nr:N-acetylmuramic acid 6-phosphate etherase [Polyangia bacterium]